MSRRIQTGEYYSRGSISPFIVTSYPVTVSVFWQWDSFTSDSSQTIIGLYDASVNNQYINVGAVSTGSTVFDSLNAVNVSGGNITGNSLAANTWRHTVGVFRSSTDRELYSNGVSSGTSGASVTFPTGLDGISIGILNNLTPVEQVDDINVAEISIWNVALTVPEIKAMTNGVSPNLIRTSALKGYWPMNGPLDNEADVSGSGMQMTQTGTITLARHVSVGRRNYTQSLHGKTRHVKDDRKAVILDRLTPA